MFNSTTSKGPPAKWPLNTLPGVLASRSDYQLPPRTYKSEFIYIECRGIDPEHLFEQVTEKLEDEQWPSAGGVIDGRAILNLPDGTAFRCLTYNRDFDGWRNLILGNCHRLRLRYAVIVEGKHVRVSDGAKYHLAECRATIDGRAVSLDGSQ